MAELATFVLFAYRHEAFVAEAIHAVAKQTYRPLELIVTDDASPDSTREKIDEALRDFPADISVIRINHPQNQGIPGVINAAVRQASGRVVVFGAGDDVSEPERVAWTMRLFADPRVAFAHTAASVIDEESKLVQGREGAGHRDAELSLAGMLLGTNAPILGATCAYRVDVFREFAELPPRILREDVILPIRGLILGEGRFLASKLVRYRTHAGNLHSPAHAQSSAEMVQRNLKFADDRAACCTQLSADIAKARADGRILPNELYVYLRQETAYSAVEQRLLRTKSLFARAGQVALAWALRRIGIAKAVKLFTLFVAPFLYAPVLKVRVRLSERKRQMRHG
jgi:glycosyltransferase involved in cell wall biosynthesis